MQIGVFEAVEWHLFDQSFEGRNVFDIHDLLVEVLEKSSDHNLNDYVSLDQESVQKVRWYLLSQFLFLRGEWI